MAKAGVWMDTSRRSNRSGTATPERLPVGISAVVILSHLLSSCCRLSCTARVVGMRWDPEQKCVGIQPAALPGIHGLVRRGHSSRVHDLKHLLLDLQAFLMLL